MPDTTLAENSTTSSKTAREMARTILLLLVFPLVVSATVSLQALSVLNQISQQVAQIERNTHAANPTGEAR